MTVRVCVTGAVGFIGSHVCAALVRAGYRVRGLDNFDPYYDRVLKDAARARLTALGVRVVEGDVRDRRTLAGAVGGAEAVVHLAARPGVRASLRDPRRCASVNVRGTARLLDACARAGVSRVVFGSSSSVYGGAVEPCREKDAARPRSPYAATKWAGEALCRRHVRRYGGRVAALRLFTVYGPGQRPDLAIHHFTRFMTHERPVARFGGSGTARDYTHVDDVVRGVTAALGWTATGSPAFEAFNVGAGRPVRLDDLIDLLASTLGLPSRVLLRPPQPGDVGRTHADITKAREILGYEPRVAIEPGIAEFVDWYRGGTWT